MEIHDQQLILLDISTGDKDRIEERLKSFSVIVDFHPDMRYGLIKLNPREPVDRMLSHLQLNGYNVKPRSEIQDDEWEFLNTKLQMLVPDWDGKTNMNFYSQHFYLFDRRNISLDEELSKFLSLTTMGPGDIYDRHKMLNQLQEILSFGRIHPFGSFLTQLGDKSSDVDVYFEDFEGRNKKIVMKDVELFIDMARVNNGKKFCTIQQSLSWIRIPLITFLHLETNIKCDISFENIMSVQNSRLIRFLISIDPVVRPLMIMIRSWARFYNLINRDGLKNYTITLLVIVLLVRKKILPSVHLLQQLAPPLLVGVWNVGFCGDLNVLNKFIKCDNSMYIRPSDIMPHVLDFFDMVLSITEKVTVCTLTSEFLRRTKFSPGNEDELPNSQERYLLWSDLMKQNNGPITQFVSKRRLSVQDPFCLSYNVASNLTDAYYFRFMQAARETSSRIRSSFLPKLLNLFLPLDKDLVRGRRRRHESKKAKPFKTVSSLCSTFNNSQVQVQSDTTPSNSFTLLLTVDKQFENAFFSHAHLLRNDESHIDLLCKMRRLWYKAVVAFFKKGIDRELQFFDRTKGSTNRGEIKTAIVLEEETITTKLESLELGSNLEKTNVFSHKGEHVDMSNISWINDQVIRLKYDNLSTKIPFRHTIQFQFTLNGANTIFNSDDENLHKFSCYAKFELVEPGPQVTVVITEISHNNNEPLEVSYMSVMKKKLQHGFDDFAYRRFENWLIFPTKPKQ